MYLGVKTGGELYLSAFSIYQQMTIVVYNFPAHTRTRGAEDFSGGNDRDTMMQGEPFSRLELCMKTHCSI